MKMTTGGKPRKQMTKDEQIALLKETGSILAQENTKLREQVKNLTIPVVSKRTFFFDYLGAAYKNEFGHYVADSRTQEIEAYDEEHATLLFKDMHPDKQFDPPY